MERGVCQPTGRDFLVEIRSPYINYEISRRDICYNNDISLDYIHIYYYESRRDMRWAEGLQSRREYSIIITSTHRSRRAHERRLRSRLHIQ